MGSASRSTFAYMGVEQLPAELPLEASQMFSDKLSIYLPSILEYASSDASSSFEDQTACLPAEIKRAIVIDRQGLPAPDYSEGLA